MTKTTKHTAGVAAIVTRAKAYESRMGCYVEHSYNENRQFSVRLSNNTAVTMSEEIADDQERTPNSVTPERIQAVAKTFREIG
jgi:hypothetical protein